MAEGLEHRKTRVLEGSSMAVGGEGGAPSGNLVSNGLVGKSKVLLRF